jgi:hypothetical protein
MQVKCWSKLIKCWSNANQILVKSLVKCWSKLMTCWSNPGQILVENDKLLVNCWSKAGPAEFDAQDTAEMQAMQWSNAGQKPVKPKAQASGKHWSNAGQN